MHPASSGACRCPRAQASCTQYCTLVTRAHTRRGSQSNVPEPAALRYPPAAPSLHAVCLLGLANTHYRRARAPLSLRFAPAGGRARCSRPVFPCACAVTLAGKLRRLGPGDPALWGRGTSVQQSGMEERDREGGISYLSLAPLRLQGQRAKWGQGTMRTPPASLGNLCSAQRALLSAGTMATSKNGGREGKGRGWTAPRVCALGPDQIYFPFHSLYDNE